MNIIENIFYLNKPSLYLVFCHRPINSSLMSRINRITRRKTASQFDHVALLFVEKGRKIIVESSAPKGCIEIPFEDWIKGREGSYITTIDLRASYFERSEIWVDFIRNEEGKKYDYFANLVWYFGWLKLLNWRKDKKRYCSELVAKLLNFKDPHKITPGILAEFYQGWESRYFIIEE